jgi:hypothetical protein
VFDLRTVDAIGRMVGKMRSIHPASTALELSERR